MLNSINLTVQIMINQKALKLAKKLWDYHQLHHTLEKSGCILVLGSIDTRTAERGADIICRVMLPFIIFSGDCGANLQDVWTGTEAELFTHYCPRQRRTTRSHLY